MDYPYENLGPERFQLFCQSLITREYPRTQCFPVGQPDGGRDAVSYLFPRTKSEKFVVFQVKYARSPMSVTDAGEWLAAVLKDELPKVSTLKERGAAEYILITNVPGSAHLQVGSIDKIGELLSTSIPVPAQCWWRNDVSRRLDNAWSLKWVFTELMTGSDFLRWIVETGLTEDKERRDSTIRAFLRSQYDMDEEVRFKQVELQNKLLDLFIDVPMSFKDEEANRLKALVLYHGLSSLRSEENVRTQGSHSPINASESEARKFGQKARVFGAATALLSNVMQRDIPLVVLEGGPGQGKSTITQYVCQVHRMRLLGETDALESLADEHRQSPPRLPIRVDLRDFASWMGRIDPFNADSGNNLPKTWHRSLEAFLAALVSHHAGGMEFDTNDLVAVARISALLLVFDGLDEVADIGRRQELVDELTRGIQRLSENAGSIQVVVTSRPAAFANSPGMPRSKYSYLQLLSLNKALIMHYAERWLRARHVDSRESIAFKGILRQKVDQPHLRDLARNPMQLTILLTLILTRGSSLPDKRTALYDFYIDTFLTREAAKSDVVRDHRELLINIHRYLGWLLQSEAETESARAAISQDRLLKVVTEYLAKEGHETGLAQALFAGMVERVVALVSRIQGTFEFEVQPLREFFAACHLYYTAPQSSPGKEMPGSKPDRFDAIARNFYWLNVARFYGGCYSKGELPSLAERLDELVNDSAFKLISHPRTLTATLLSDWVFAQNPRSVQQLAELLFNGGGKFLALPMGEPAGEEGRLFLSLPSKCGGQVLVDKAFASLCEEPPAEVEDALITILHTNFESPNEISQRWLEQYRLQQNDNGRLRWLERAQKLDVLSTFGLEELNKIVPQSAEARTAAIMFAARRLDFAEQSEHRFDHVISAILDGLAPSWGTDKVESVLDALNMSVQPFVFSSCFRLRQPTSLLRFLQQADLPVPIWDSRITSKTESYRGHRFCVEMARLVEEELKRAAEEWATSLRPWDRIIEFGRQCWGDRWAFDILANAACGIHSAAERCLRHENLYDSSSSLAKRARYARLRSRNVPWWNDTLSLAKDARDGMRSVLLASTWLTTGTLLSVIEPLTTVLNRLTGDEWRQTFVAARSATWNSYRTDRGELPHVESLPDPLSQRAASLLALRADTKKDATFLKKFFRDRPAEDNTALEFRALWAADMPNFGTPAWAPDLSTLDECSHSRLSIEPFLALKPYDTSALPLSTCQAIMGRSSAYPDFMVVAAEERCRNEVAAGVTPVAAVAAREGWFGL